MPRPITCQGCLKGLRHAGEGYVCAFHPEVIPMMDKVFKAIDSPKSRDDGLAWHIGCVVWPFFTLHGQLPSMDEVGVLLAKHFDVLAEAKDPCFSINMGDGEVHAEIRRLVNVVEGAFVDLRVPTEHDKLLTKLGPLNEPRESRLSGLLRIHRVINDVFTIATTELLSTDLDLLEELIIDLPRRPPHPPRHQRRLSSLSALILENRIRRAIEVSEGGSASDAVQNMLAVLRGDDDVPVTKQRSETANVFPAIGRAVGREEKFEVNSMIFDPDSGVARFEVTHVGSKWHLIQIDPIEMNMTPKNAARAKEWVDTPPKLLLTLGTRYWPKRLSLSSDDNQIRLVVPRSRFHIGPKREPNDD